MKKYLSVLAFVVCACVCTSCDDNSINSPCHSDQYLNHDGFCIDNDLGNCGVENYDCYVHMLGFEAGKCVSGRCLAESCEVGYYVDHQVCIADKCVLGQHTNMDSGQCEDDNVDNCGQTGRDCHEDAGFLEGSCKNRKCIATLCSDNYELVDGKCIAPESQGMVECKENHHAYEGACEVDNVNHCGEHNKVCENAMPGFLTGRCENGGCVAESCKAGYALENGKCVNLDPTSTTCPDGEHDNHGICEPDDVNNCGAVGHVCDINHFPNAAEIYCIVGQCALKSCKEGYGFIDGLCIQLGCEIGQHINGGVCEPDDIEHCGGFQKACKDEMPGFLSGRCENRTCIAESCLKNYELQEGKCLYVNACPTGEHDNNGTCEADDINNCGAHGKVCRTSDFPYSDTVQCVDGQCVVKYCVDYYYEVDGACLGPNCGKDMHISGATCKPDDLNNCGADGSVCQTSDFPYSDSVECSDGLCGVKSCEQYYTLSYGKCVGPNCGVNQHKHNGICEPDDLNNCGSHGNVCKTSDIPYSDTVQCVNGKCVAKSCEEYYSLSDGICVGPNCNADQHKYNGTCEPDDLNNCGTHNKVCEKADHAKAMKCENKICQILSCISGYYLKNGECVSVCNDSMYYCAEKDTCCTANHCGGACEDHL